MVRIRRHLLRHMFGTGPYIFRAVELGFGSLVLGLLRLARASGL